MTTNEYTEQSARDKLIERLGKIQSTMIGSMLFTHDDVADIGGAAALLAADKAGRHPVLVRDLAEIIGKDVPMVCAAIAELGFGKRSTNMALHPDEAIAVAKHFADKAGGEVSVPPFGTKRKAAMAIYTPPFRFEHGYIFDSNNHMVADQGGVGEKDTVKGAVAAQVRGWGRIGYMPNGAELQDEIGQMLADALNAYYAESKPQPSALPDDVVKDAALTALKHIRDDSWPDAELNAAEYAAYVLSTIDAAMLKEKHE